MEIENNCQILFIRHSQTETTGKVLPGRTPGLKISEQGKIKAKELATNLFQSNILPTAIYSSPMQRAKETAQPFEETFNLQSKELPGVNEAEFGEWTGKKLEDLRKLPEWKKVQHNPSDFRFPMGESFVEILSRTSTTIQELIDTHNNETILVFSHADIIKIIACQALGMHLDMLQKIIISPCSLTAITYQNNRSYVTQLNNNGSDYSVLKGSK